MKKIFCFSLLFFNLAVSAQHQKTVYRFIPTITNTTIKPIAFKYNFSQKKIFLNGNNLNDNHFRNQNSFNLNLPKSFPYSSLDEPLNPNGVYNFGKPLFGSLDFLNRAL